MEMTLERKHEVREKQIMLPISRVLDEYTPKPVESKSLNRDTSSVMDTLNELFPEQEHYSKDLIMVKQALGTLAWELTFEQLQNLMPEVQYLCESWLDDFERTVFKGKTLKELLHEKGGGK